MLRLYVNSLNYFAFVDSMICPYFSLALEVHEFIIYLQVYFDIYSFLNILEYVYYSNLNCAGWEMRGNRNPASVNNYHVFSGRITVLASRAQNLNSFECSHPLPRWLGISLV